MSADGARRGRGVCGAGEGGADEGQNLGQKTEPCLIFPRNRSG